MTQFVLESFAQKRKMSDIFPHKCRGCELSNHRSRVVMGDGPRHAKILLLGEAPGADEDRGGRPFIGRSGKLLIDTFQECGISREDLYITNTVKCRPPSNRKPKQSEIISCNGMLKQEIHLQNPDVIMCLGATPTQTLLELESVKMGDLVGTWNTVNISGRKYRVVVNYHPAACLYNSQLIGTFTHIIQQLVEKKET